MEVHHHPHVANLPAGQAGKNFKEYFFEFIMIFLAVTLGFIAESTRERVAEQKHAKEYAKSFLTDLINDTADINRSAASDRLSNSMTDSLIHFINKANIIQEGGEFYYLSYRAGWTYTTDWNKATINQLISSGSLRYFTNSQLVIKINEYNTVTNEISDVQKGILERGGIALTYRNHILKSRYLLLFENFGVDNVTKNTTPGFIDSLRKTNIPLENSDAGIINDYANAVMTSNSNRGFLLTNLYPRAKKEAEDIMQLLKQEYHLKKE